MIPANTIDAANRIASRIASSCFSGGRALLVRAALTGVASENSIHLTRSHRRIRTRSSDDCNRPLVRPYAVRLLQAATAAGSRNPNTAASAQRPAAAHAAPPAAFALD